MNHKLIVRIVVTAIVVIGVGVIAYATTRNNPTVTDTMAHSHDDSHHHTDDGSLADSTAVMDTNQITYKGFSVVEKTIRVKKGTTVTWTNQDNAKHDVTPVTETDEFKTSELFGKGETYSVTFNTVGNYAYYCSPHPYMKGTIEVTE